MRPINNQIFSLAVTLLITFFSLNAVIANTNSLIDCDASFWSFPEGTSAFFEPQIFYDDATYLWDFGDGTTSSETHPIHDFIVDQDNFVFEVTLTITLENGEVCTQTNVFTMFSEECNSMFTYNVQEDGVTVNFEDTSWGIITSWLWDFGDGNTSTEQHPVHVYENGGDYEVNLSIECLGGETNSMPMPILVVYEPIECDASFHYEFFNNEFYFSPNNILDIASYSWDFGDGTSTNDIWPTHTYENAEPGDVFVVTLIVTFQNGETCTTQDDITIEVIDECTSMFEYQVISDDGLTIEFIDQSWGNLVQWLWDFGDGTSSTESNPIHTYTTFGDYEVTLIITCANGEVNTMTMPVHVGNGGDCDAFFWYSQELNQVYFYPSFDNPATTYLWDFGDGSTSSEIYAVHTYDIGNEPSEFNVTLTITLADGTSCVYTEFVFLEPLECNSMFSYYPVDDNELEIQFIDESWGIPTSWLWDFGDGNTSVEENPIHEYAEIGVYNVTLTIDCVGGETSTMEMPAHVGDVLFCDAFFWYEIDFSVNAFYFYPSIEMDDAVYNWDFGDGTTSSAVNPVHTYNQGQDPQEYIVTLVLTLSDGQICTYEEWIYVEPVECNAMFEYGPAPDNGLVIGFWDTSWGTVTSWFWDFGDGSTSTEPNPTHVYNNEGEYEVSLTITCAGGEVNTIVLIVYTSGGGNNQCEAAFESYLLDDWGVYFESALIYEEAEYFWDFGDGTTSTEMMPTHYYTADGWYPVFLEIILPNGVSCYYDSEILIGGDNPDLPIHCEAFFSFEQTDDAMTIAFFNQSFTDNDEIDFQWHFGDGVTSTEPDPVHHYETPGIYIVTLTIISGDCVDTFPMQIFVGDETYYPEGCQALFLPVATNSGYIFYDLSSGDVTSYLWDFGDGNLSTNETPFHNYAIPGDYEVTLTITTADGCESMFSIGITNTGYMGNGIQAYMVTSTSIPETLNDIKVFPNPTSSFLNLEFEITSNTLLTFEIQSIDGKILESSANNFSAGIFQKQFNVEYLKQGIYMLKIVSKDSSEQYKFIKL